jgi:hypothetical protein
MLPLVLLLLLLWLLLLSSQKYLDFVKAQGLTVDADGFITGPFTYAPGGISPDPQKDWVLKGIRVNNFTNIVGELLPLLQISNLYHIDGPAGTTHSARDITHNPRHPCCTESTVPCRLTLSVTCLRMRIKWLSNAAAGAYNGDSRFARMAMLKSAAKLQCYITNSSLTPTSPGVAPAGYPRNWPSLLTVRQIIETVALPRGEYVVLQLATSCSSSYADLDL